MTFELRGRVPIPEGSAPAHPLRGRRPLTKRLPEGLAPRPSKTILSSMIEAAPDAFVGVDADGFIVEWNPEAERLFGWNKNEVLGQQLILVPNAGFNGTGPGHLAALMPAADQHRLRMPVFARDGTAVPVEVTLWPSGDSGRPFYGAFFRALPASAEVSEELMCPVGSIVESSDAAITSEDLDGRLLTWNRAAEEIYGYPAGEVVGEAASVIVPADRRDEVAHHRQSACRGHAVANHETVRLRKDGSLIDVAVTISPVYDSLGRVAGVSTIARDITEQRRMAAALEAALEDAKRSEERSRRFLADAAHQLRNPIASIRACCDTLLHISSQRGRERLLSQLISEASRSTRLVNELLRMARLDTGEARVARRPCDLELLCRQEAEAVAVLEPGLQILVRTVCQVGKDPMVDEDAVRDILANLLGNARRHAKQRIEVLIATGDDGQLEIRVADDGPGLPPGTEEIAFARFASLDGKGGSGLGLAIARSLARASGGDLTYDGAFVLRLPDEGQCCDL